MACLMSRCLASAHFPAWTFFFFGGGGGVGQLAGEFFMCYFNMVLNEITCPGPL